MREGEKENGAEKLNITMNKDLLYNLRKNLFFNLAYIY